MGLTNAMNTTFSTMSGGYANISFEGFFVIYTLIILLSLGSIYVFRKRIFIWFFSGSAFLGALYGMYEIVSWGAREAVERNFSLLKIIGFGILATVIGFVMDKFFIGKFLEEFDKKEIGKKLLES